MLGILKQLLQSVLIWLLLLINGGQLPAELLPPIDWPPIDWESIIGLGAPWQIDMQASLDDYDVAAARRQRPSTQALPEADAMPQGSSLRPVSMGSLRSSGAGDSALTGAMAAGMGATGQPDPTTRIVNPSGVPRELLGGVNPWRSSTAKRTSASMVATEIVGAAPVEGRGPTIALVLLGAGALATAGYVVTRRRR